MVLRESVAAAELKIETIEAGIQRYVANWYRIDSAYRKFRLHARRYGQVALLERIVERVEKTYLDEFCATSDGPMGGSGGEDGDLAGGCPGR